MGSLTEERLWFWAQKFSSHFAASGYAELLKVENSLQDPSDPENRNRALVFSMYQLLINGAIAEHNVYAYKSQLPDFVRSRLKDRYLEDAVVKAWQGSAYSPQRSNILGSISFMVVLLFFLESACRMVLNEDDRPFAGLVEDLRAKSLIDEESKKALLYLGEFRNVWHNFGFYKTNKTTVSYRPKSTPLTIPDLIGGQVIKPIAEEQSMHFLEKVLTAFCTLTGVKT